MIDQKETDAAAAMSAAERLVDQLDSFPDPPERAELLAVASFLLRLAAALLLEKDFLPLPEGLDVLIARDQSRVAGRYLSSCMLEEQSSLMRRKALQLPPDPRRAGRPLTDHAPASRSRNRPHASKAGGHPCGSVLRIFVPRQPSPAAGRAARAYRRRARSAAPILAGPAAAAAYSRAPPQTGTGSPC